MKKRALSIAILAAMVIAPYAGAQTAASAPAASAAAVDPAAVEALQRMGANLQSLKRFTVSTQLIGERVLEDGQKLQHTATAVLDVDRPNRIRADMTSARSHR
jgi:hypothetical protein